MPTLITHGEEDFLIPISEAEGLYQHSAAQEKWLVRIPQAGHNDLMVVGMQLAKPMICGKQVAP